MRACIITNSPQVSATAIEQQSARADLVIVTDGAAHLLPEGVHPHVICGDFDSIDRSAAEKRFSSAEFIHSECQETNDLEKCIKLALTRGARELSIVGTLGGRIDQALTNLSILECYHKELALVFHDGEMSCRVFSNRGAKPTIFVCSSEPGDCISLIPRIDSATVSLSGVRWPLSAERLTPGSRGVSNEALEKEVVLTVHSGVVLFIHGAC
jgi:thiamine pyrophosphokinase